MADRMMVDEMLAEAVRVYPVLYDKSSGDFKDRNKKDLAWKDVAEKLGFSSGKDAESAFKNLRNRYSRDKKKVQSARVSGTDTQSVSDVKSETSELYSFLAWLDPYVQPRRSATNLMQVEVLDVDEDTVDIGDDLRSQTPEVSCESDSSESIKSRVTGRPKHMKRPRAKGAKDDGIDKAELELIKSIGVIGNRIAHVQKQKEKDEENLFGELIASQLRQMPDQERLIAKMEINNIVYAHLLKGTSSSQQGQYNVDHMYCGGSNTNSECRNSVLPVINRQNTAAPQPQHPLQLQELGSAGNNSAFPPGYFFQHHRQ